uniref:akirin-2 isoform X1 n=2 Tax=Ictidomys tridecemlineatus TaxID=43179 RepID=UPI001AA00C30|nr:akirin-2 isoform X1 [Ictidomys tridecemlineatus]
MSHCSKTNAVSICRRSPTLGKCRHHLSPKVSSEKVQGDIMEAQDQRHKREREPDTDSDTNSESGLDIIRTMELTPAAEEQILYNIKQEYKRMQKRRHLETSFQQTDPGCSSDAQPHAFLLSGPASPGTSSATSSPLKKEQPLFTLRQVGMICERLLKEREEKVREEYEEILNTKLAEQYDAFVKFTHDQIMRRYGEQPASYVS